MKSILLAFTLLAALAGCGGDDRKNPAKSGATTEAGIQENLAKLSPEDRKLAETQKFCAVQTKSRLGSMGIPIKITLKGQPVFLCCDHCKSKAEADSDKTLAQAKKLRSAQ
jgi:hypothetical protein